MLAWKEKGGAEVVAVVVVVATGNKKDGAFPVRIVLSALVSSEALFESTVAVDDMLELL